MAKSNPLKNLPLNKCRKFLTNAGCKNIRTKGGHEVWARADLLSPIIIQTHVDPVPEFIMKQILKKLDIDKDEFLKKLKGK